MDFSSASPNDFGSAGPAINDFVSVKGAPLALIGGNLTASSVEDEDRSFADAANAEIEGFISAAAGSTFTLVTGAGTFQFRIDATTEIEGGIIGELAVGMEVEVEGAFSGGLLLADKVEVKDGIKLETNIDIATRDVGNLTIEPANMPALILKLNDQTEIDDNRDVPVNNPTPLIILNSLDGTETLRVRARISNTPVANATELVVTDLRISDNLPPVIELRGPLDAPPNQAGDLLILGVTVSSSEPGTTFFDIEDREVSRAEFLNRVTTGTLVEADGTLSVDNQMSATQLDIED